MVGDELVDAAARLAVQRSIPIPIVHRAVFEDGDTFEG